MIENVSRAARVQGAALSAALVFAMCGLAATPSHDAGDRGEHSTLAISTPLSTSIQTSGGLWAAVPMGHLGQPLNTFWQLLNQPAGATAWSDQVEATATGTNGGLVFASPDNRTLDVGIRPSNLLTFSPLISTANNGRSWSDGLLVSGLASRPNALAADGDHSLALVGTGHGEKVEASSTTLSSWRTLVSERTLASTSSGKTCGLTAMTAVGLLSGNTLVGGECSRPGVVPLFERRGAKWHLVRLGHLPSVDQSRFEVLGVQSTNSGVRSLLGILDGSRIRLVEVRSSANGTWSVSEPLSVASGDHVRSYGPSGASGLFVLLSTTSGVERLETVGDPGLKWNTVLAPPNKTATIAVGPGTEIEALSVNDTVLTIWRLDPGAGRWVRAQVMNVPIVFGSAS